MHACMHACMNKWINKWTTTIQYINFTISPQKKQKQQKKGIRKLPITLLFKIISLWNKWCHKKKKQVKSNVPTVISFKVQAAQSRPYKTNLKCILKKLRSDFINSMFNVTVTVLTNYWVKHQTCTHFPLLTSQTRHETQSDVSSKGLHICHS